MKIFSFVFKLQFLPRQICNKCFNLPFHTIQDWSEIHRFDFRIKAERWR